ncbi:hypothetical protein BGX27_006841 [Mortierella sp. AM989]|nr:hypothetical protein BGX27_006841 [Mortierella sp. AM989]
MTPKNEKRSGPLPPTNSHDDREVIKLTIDRVLSDPLKNLSNTDLTSHSPAGLAMEVEPPTCSSSPLSPFQDLDHQADGVTELFHTDSMAMELETPELATTTVEQSTLAHPHETDENIEMRSASSVYEGFKASDTAPNSGHHHIGPGLAGSTMGESNFTTQVTDVVNEVPRAQRTPRAKGIPRTQICISTKLEIISHKEKYPRKTHAEIANYFGMPRTTVSCILKQKDGIQKHRDESQAKPNASQCRMKKPQSDEVEKALVPLVLGKQKQGSPMSGSEIRAEALIIDKRLSDKQGIPLSGCRYTTGWLESFKKRNNISSTPQESESWRRDCERLGLSGFQSKDVYFLDVANLTLDVSPSITRNTSILFDVSVLLLSNGTGSFMPKPQMIFGMPDQMENIDGAVESIESMVVRGFLELSKSVSCKSVLLVDNTMEEYLKASIKANTSQLLTVVVVPVGVSPLLPMANLKNELKTIYSKLVSQNREGSQSKQLLESILIIDAWSKVDLAIFESSFEKFWKAAVLDKAPKEGLCRSLDQSKIDDCNKRKK